MKPKVKQFFRSRWGYPSASCLSSFNMRSNQSLWPEASVADSREGGWPDTVFSLKVSIKLRAICRSLVVRLHGLVNLSGQYRESLIWESRDSEIHCCGIISMHILRFFLMPPSPTIRGCALARRRIRVLTRGPRPISLPSTNTPAVLGSIALGLDRLFRFLPADLLHPKPPFKSHSAPRPPQTPAASS